MRYLLIVLLLFIGCKGDYGCMDEAACNYDASAILGGHCNYAEENYDCDGNCIVYNPVGCITGNGCCLFEASLYDDGITDNTIVQFSEELDLSQFTIGEFYLSYECEEDPTGYCDLNINTDGIYKISNPEKFGVDCFLYYDNNYKILSGYEVTNEFYPDGTGDGCHLTDLNNIISTSGQSLSLDVNNSYTSNSSIQAVPNPYMGFSNYPDSAVNFTSLPQSCTINIKTPYEQIISFEHSDWFSGNHYWNLTNSDGVNIDSGIYVYEVLVNDVIVYRNSAIILMPNP